MQQARGGMGSHKHGTSGRAPKSPKLRLAVRMEAERDERKPRTARMVVAWIAESILLVSHSRYCEEDDGGTIPLIRM